MHFFAKEIVYANQEEILSNIKKFKEAKLDKEIDVTALTSIDLSTIPNEYYQQHESQLPVAPDGTGIQILYKVDGEYYNLSGPRGGKVITVNGGTIDNQKNPLFTQIDEELTEENFGRVKIIKEGDNKYSLLLNNKYKYNLAILNDKTAVSIYADGGFSYTYVTFTAVCELNDLAPVIETANAITPTAAYWNRMGTFLFNAKNELSVLFKNKNEEEKPVIFAKYWKDNYEKRNQLINDLIKDYDDLTSKQQLLIDPIVVFLGDKNKGSIADALNELHKVENFKQFLTLFNHTVGRYSERPLYSVFKISDIFLAAHGVQGAKDIKGNIVSRNIFNGDAVKATLPAVDPWLETVLVEAKSKKEEAPAMKYFASSKSEENKEVPAKTAVQPPKPEAEKSEESKTPSPM